MIFVTVGTHEQSFNRLLKKIDELKKDGIIQEDVIMQTGFSTYEPKYCEWSKLIPYQQMIKNVEDARIIITHGGPASFIMPLQIGKTPIVVPRQHRFDEHVNDHQVEFARNVAERMGTIIPVEDISTLGDVIKNYDDIVAKMASPFLYGVYCSKHKAIEVGRHSTVILGIISLICLLSFTILGDNVITTLLLYLCTLSLWNVLPNFTLKADSIIKNDMFIVYSIHEGIIIVMLAVLNKGNVHFGKYISLIFVILLETVLIVTIGFCLNLIISRLPTVFNIIFTGDQL